MSWLNIEEKTVIVTGGASGIGKAVSEAFLAQGCKVVVSDMNPSEPEVAGATDDNFLYVVTDVTKKEDVENMVQMAVARFGRVDVLVNNAGINIPHFWWMPRIPAASTSWTKRSGTWCAMST